MFCNTCLILCCSTCEVVVKSSVFACFHLFVLCCFLLLFVHQKMLKPAPQEEHYVSVQPAARSIHHVASTFCRSIGWYPGAMTHMYHIPILRDFGAHHEYNHLCALLGVSLPQPSSKTFQRNFDPVLYSIL